MSAKITAPQLTSNTVLFANRAAAQTFFDGFTAPDATPSAAGVVKKATSVNYTSNPANTPEYNTLNIMNDDGSYSSVKLVPQATYEDLMNKYNDLSAKFAQLVTNLNNAGITG